VWAPFSGVDRADAPWGLRRRVALVAGAVLGAVTLWFFVVLLSDGSDVGLAERCAAGAQAVWPAVVVASVPRLRSRP